MKKIYLTITACIAFVTSSLGQWVQSGTTGNYYLSTGNAAVGAPCFRLSLQFINLKS